MVSSTRTQIKCPNCGQPFATPVEQVIDGGRDPQAKARLLAGRTNIASCPNCHAEFRITAPLLYHDANKELLLIHVPMELGLPTNEQERMIGSMTNAIVNSLPQEQRKGYLLMPKTALTLSGMIETILESDGVTRDMIDARRAKLRLAESFLQNDPDEWDKMVQEHDAEIDAEFFTLLGMSAEAAVANGRQDVAEAMLSLREHLLANSTAGQALLEQAKKQDDLIQEVAKSLDAFGQDATRDDLIRLAIEMAQKDADAGDDARLQVLVGLVRPVMDYQFFMDFAKYIETVPDGDKAFLNDVRDKLVAFTQAVDAQAERIYQQAAQHLEAIVNSPDLDAAIREHADAIDDTFLAVLASNIQNAEQTGNIMASAKFKEVQEKILSMLQESAPPPLRFINELLSQRDEDVVEEMINQQAAEFGPELLQIMDVLLQELETRGANPTQERLRALREQAALVIEGGGPAPRQEKGSPVIIPFTRKNKKK